MNLFVNLLAVFHFSMFQEINCLKTGHLQKRDTGNGEIVFPGTQVHQCPSEDMSCVPKDDCSHALDTICKWDGNQPLFCCLSQVTNTKIKTQSTEFPEVDCSQTEGWGSGAAVGGTTVTTIDKYPFMVSIFQTTNFGRHFQCGGSLLSKTLILTAAHCFLSKDSSIEYLVRLGSINIQSNTNETGVVELAVTSVKVHPEFKYPQLYNDIALLKIEGLADYSPSVSPICLSYKADDQNSETQLVMLGWGATQAGGSDSILLQEVEVNVTANSECGVILSKLGGLRVNFPHGITDDVLCAGNTNNISKDACQGDSGGPAVVRVIDGTWRQRGIVSSGIGCGMKGVPGIYTRVSQYTNWIKQNA